MDNLYLCVKNKDDKFIPFFIVQGSFFSKNSQKSNEISGGTKTSNNISSNGDVVSNDTGTSDNLCGGANSCVSLDEILQHVNYKEVLENDKLKDNQPILENDLKGGKIEIEISNQDNVFESALPEDFKKYLNYKLNK